MTRNDELLKELRIDRSAMAAPPSSRGAWIAGGVAVAVLLLAALGWALFGRAKPLEVKTATVVVAPTGGGAGSASVLDATGYVVARRMATVSSKVTGRVREVRIEEGQRVAAGEILAILDPIDADAARRLAADQYAAARASVAGKTAQLREAEANAARLGDLAKRQLVSRAQFDQAVAQRDALRAEAAWAEKNAQVAASALQIAGNAVDDTVVRAPFAGVVVAKAAQPGEIVSPLSAGGGFTRTGIGTIVDMDSLEVEVDVSESYIGRVQPGMAVEAVLNAYPDWTIPAEVIAIIPTADRAKATVKVRIALKAKDARIVPDMGVRVSFLEKAAPAAAATTGAPRTRVPNAALRQDAGQDVVFLLRDGVVERRAVRLGGARGDEREVVAGLGGGETVVLDPPATLKDGDAVREAAAR